MQSTLPNVGCDRVFKHMARNVAGRSSLRNSLLHLNAVKTRAALRNRGGVEWKCLNEEIDFVRAQILERTQADLQTMQPRERRGRRRERLDYLQRVRGSGQYRFRQRALGRHLNGQRSPVGYPCPFG